MSKQFSDLGINSELQARLKDIDIIEPTEVQKKVIPFILQRKKDLVALAKVITVKLLLALNNIFLKHIICFNKKKVNFLGLS